MGMRRWPRRNDGTGSKAARKMMLFFLLLAMAVSATLGLALRGMVTEYAASTARDLAIITVNDIVKDVMNDLKANGTELVNLERDANGTVTAITTNVVAINLLSAEVLSRAVEQTEKEYLTVEIPVMNLLGSALLMNRGPSIAVHATMLSSSTAGFRSEITSAGINQTRHQLFLDLNVQMSFLMPWRGMDTSVQTEILVSETVVVGQVPDSYMNWER